jgi:cysteine desulfurase
MSDPEALYNSLRKIHAALGPRSLLCPAHDYNNSFATSLETEVRENPILALAVHPPHGLDPIATLKMFLEKKREIDTELERIEQNFQGIVCGVANTSGTPCDVDTLLSSDALRARLRAATGHPLLVIDVREPQEVSLFKEWGALGLGEAPRNVPLSRFVNFMSELATSGNNSPDIVLICRSGNRSLQAAKTLTRLGLARAWSLEGGIAL